LLVIETQFFVSSCTRREWSQRRAPRRNSLIARLMPLAITFSFVAIGVSAFVIGRFGI
jgi:hypothetical protein